MKLAILAILAATVAAFVPAARHNMKTELSAEKITGRREFMSGLAGGLGAFAIGAFAPAANAIRDYENIEYLGGGQVVDINNANVRVYLKMPGLYPTVAGKIASNGPYKSVGEIYNIPGLTGPEKDMMKKYESRFVAKSPAADYVIDRINNGL